MCVYVCMRMCLQVCPCVNLSLYMYALCFCRCFLVYSSCKLHLFHCPQLCGESRFGLNERIIPFQVSLCFSYLVRATFLFTFTWLCFHSFQGWPLSTARPLRKQATKQLDSSLPTAKSFRDLLFSMVSYFRHVSSKMVKGEEYIEIMYCSLNGYSWQL